MLNNKLLASGVIDLKHLSLIPFLKVWQLPVVRRQRWLSPGNSYTQQHYKRNTEQYDLHDWIHNLEILQIKDDAMIFFAR